MNKFFFINLESKKLKTTSSLLVGFVAFFWVKAKAICYDYCPNDFKTEAFGEALIFGLVSAALVYSIWSCLHKTEQSISTYKRTFSILVVLITLIFLYVGSAMILYSIL